MKLSKMVAYLTKRLPADSEIVDFELSAIIHPEIGIIETFRFSNDDEEDDPGEGESASSICQNRAKLRAVS